MLCSYVFAYAVLDTVNLNYNFVSTTKNHLFICGVQYLSETNASSKPNSEELKNVRETTRLLMCFALIIHTLSAQTSMTSLILRYKVRYAVKAGPDDSHSNN